MANCELRIANKKWPIVRCTLQPAVRRLLSAACYLPLAIFSLLIMSGCAFGAEPQPLVLGDAPWQSGERSVYTVINREEQVAGSAVFEIHANDKGTPAGWTFTRLISDIGITERVTVSTQARGYIPIQSTLTRSSSAGTQRVQATFNQTRVEMELNNLQGLLSYESVNVTSDVRDDRTLVPLLRTLPLAQGYATFINSFLPITGQQERVAIRVAKGESVTVPAGSFESWLVELKTTDRTSRIWIAKEAPHAVVKWVDGRSQATFELSEFEPIGSP